METGIDKLIIKALALCAVTATLTIGSCNIHLDYRIAKAIEQGNDPILSRAAFVCGDGTYERIIHLVNENK